MKCLIAALIKGKAGRFQQKLLYDVAKRFKVNGAVKRRPPAHITLKYSFKTSKIKEVEEAIKDFCKKNKSCRYKLKGFSYFGRDVIFIEVFPSKEMKKLHKKLILQLYKIKGMKRKKWDKTTHFHSSIAHSDIKGKFKEIWGYVKNKKCDFKIELDNITILKMSDGVWKVHKKFSL